MRTLLLRSLPILLTLGVVSSASAQYACTMDAKLCPDGETYVGREGPNCEFAPCPGERQACTKELKICPDGTGVGRTGPNCEFTPCPSGFSDVPDDHPNAEAISFLKTKGVVEGYQDGLYFSPYFNINRAEFLKIVLEAWVAADDDQGHVRGVGPCFMHESESEFTALYGRMTDIDFDTWYGNYLCYSVRKGWVQGYPDRTFRPAASINFVEAAKILVNAFDLEASTTIPACEGDCPWYRPYVLTLEMHGAIPTSITSFGQFITRGEMAEMAYRLITHNNDKPSQTYEGLSTTIRAGVEYTVRYNYDINPGSSEPYDGQLVAIDTRTGEESILVSSIKNALPVLKERSNLTLAVVALPQSGTAILKVVLMDTDNSSGDLYSFSPDTLRFTKMKLNERYDGFYDGSTISPSQNFVAWTEGASQDDEVNGNMKYLYVGSLANDTYWIAVTLSGNETLNGGEFAMSSKFDIEWIGEGELRYAVYDQSMKGPSSMGTLIEYRTVKI